MKEQDLRILSVELPEDVLKAKHCGDFELAQRIIENRLQCERTPDFMKQRLLVEREILQRLPIDYSYSVSEALSLMQKHIPDYTEAELWELIESGMADWIYIKGEIRLATRFFDNLRENYSEFARRCGDVEESLEDGDGYHIKNEILQRMRSEGRQTRQITVTLTRRIREEAFQKGEVTVHLPIPKPQVNIDHIEILSTYPADGEGGARVSIGSEKDPQRTVCFQENMQENHPFSVTYRYECTALCRIDETGRVIEGRQWDKDEGFRAEDLAEEYPHIRFTDTIRTLHREILEKAGVSPEDPLKTARAMYDFVTTKVNYSYMREYITLEEIPEYATVNLKGDCGVQALLFITLCRLSGIPARWQSGAYVTPAYGKKAAESGSHDWAMFYLEPWGWFFADPSFGGGAFRSGNLDRWNYYFGNLDPYRMAANDAFQRAFCPPKQETRSDPYDNQSGEIEYAGRGLIKTQMTYETEVEVKEVQHERP